MFHYQCQLQYMLFQNYFLILSPKGEGLPVRAIGSYKTKEIHVHFAINSISQLTMIHIGHVIKNKVEEQGKTTVWLAQKLGCHRTNMYKIYEKRTIDTGVLLHISDILGFDFFKLYTEELNNAEEIVD